MAETPQRPAPITTVRDAEHAIAELNAIMDSLEQTVGEETARVRSGRVRAAIELDETKRTLSRRYTLEIERVRAGKDVIARTLPQALAALRIRHESFQALLRNNLTVLATAHAVGEGIIRGVSGEMNRKYAPSTYGASGRSNTPPPQLNQPLAVSKSL